MQSNWLSDAVFYQIYPQSFYDDNGDGIGDIQGIIRKLDYLNELGVNAVWLNPMYESPFGDAGYDVTDYRKIASRYGSVADFEQLLEQAHKKNIKIIMDFVPGHTSCEHEWFRESCKPHENACSNRYVWSDSVWKAGPNMIKGYSDRDGSYMYNFFYFQPKLNYGYADPEESWQLPFSHPDVQKTVDLMIEYMRFWLDLGIDGLRVDMAGSLVVGDTELVATKQLWGRVREMFDKDYPHAVMLSEWGYPINAVDCGFHGDFLLRSGTTMYTPLFRKEQWRNGVHFDGHSIFDMEGRGDISEFTEQFLQHMKGVAGKGHFIMPTGSHDMPRLNHRRTEQELKVMFAFVLTLPTVPIIYYGDEIAMRYIPDLVSKEGGYNRTGARTPMQWDNSPNMGFSSAQEALLYLPVDHEGETVLGQKNRKDSLFHCTKKLLSLRKSTPALGTEGSFTPVLMQEKTYPFAYLREGEGKRYLVVINPSDCEYEMQPDINGAFEILFVCGEAKASGQGIKIGKVSAAIFEVI